MTPSFAAMLLVMGAAALACRMGGFVVMRFLPPSPRLEAALRATPLAVMAAITALAATSGAIADAAALAAVIVMTVVIGNDVVAAMLGVVLVAILRGLMA